MHMTPNSSWIVILLRFWFATFWVLEPEREADIRWEVVDWKGWYSVQREQASVACVRRVAADEGEDEDKSLPVGERRRRVCS